MDYCSSCRRNLNGALVCPGCGDYAPDIAPNTHRDGSVAATATTWEAWEAWQTEVAAVPGPEAGALHSGAAPVDGGGYEEAARADASGAGPESGPAAAATGQGRAARRRQLARWKKHKRRAVAATAFALAGGALTVALLPDKASNGQTHASAAPDPEGAAKSHPLATDGAEQPDDRASRHPGARPPMTSSGHKDTTAATPPPTATHRHPDGGYTAQPSAPASAAPHSAPAPAASTHAGNGGSGGNGGSAPAPAAAPGSGTQSDAGSSSTNEEPATTPTAEPTAPSADPASPSHVCLLGVVCVG
ncbi:SCO2400 family protein [Streptomyces sirii]|uniref:SCO2400 family protein n=1 Tax=Streptomyces sirii TaxID=3127701 RepID=UPI003D364F43